MHECPKCMQACACDQDDLWQPAPDDCCCGCQFEPDGDHDEIWDLIDGYWDQQLKEQKP